jgi:hypothetical protein
MTPVELAFLTFWVGFGIRAGWMACDFLIESISAIIEHFERRQARRELSRSLTSESVQVPIEYVPAADFVRPRSHG